MKKYFLRISILALGVTSVVAPSLRASELDKKTNITINQPIEVEGTVLPAGSYVLKRVDLAAERYLVRILNANENRVITTIFTTPIYRSQPADNSEFKFYDVASGQTPSLHTWFYPGDSTGFEFKEVDRVPTVEAVQSTGVAGSNASSN